MSRLAPLLEIQEIDGLARAARERAEQRPEREKLAALEAELVALEARVAAARAERVALQGEEERIGSEVSQVAHEIEQAEVARYSGKHKDRETAQAHEESQQASRERKGILEARELELLEAIEELETQIATHEAERASGHAEWQALQELVARVDAEVDAELARLDEARLRWMPRVAPAVLAAYDHVRAQPRAAGRGAAMIAEGRCTGCRIKLPSVELRRMLAEPEDALIQCPQCRRVLVRDSVPIEADPTP